jgi:hypothetical protein
MGYEDLALRVLSAQRFFMSSDDRFLPAAVRPRPRRATEPLPSRAAVFRALAGKLNCRRRIDTARGDFLEPSPRARHRREQRRIGFPWYVLGPATRKILGRVSSAPLGERNPEVDPNTARGKLRLFNYLDQGCRPFSLREQEPTRLRRKFEHFAGRPGFQFRTPARRQAPPVCPRGRL